MADLLGTLTNLGGDTGGTSVGPTSGGGQPAGVDGSQVGSDSSGPIAAGDGDSGGSSSSFDLSKVLNVDNTTTSEQTNYSDHQSASQDSSTVDNGSESSQSFETSSNDGGGGSTDTSSASSDQDFGGSQSDSSDASHNVDYSSHSFTNDFSLDTSLDQLTQSQQHDGGGLLGSG